MLALAGIIFFLASCVLLCFGVVLKILVTQQCVSCAHTELGGDTAGTDDPKDVPDSVMLCSAIKIGEEAGRGEIRSLCSLLCMTEPLGMAKH